MAVITMDNDKSPNKVRSDHTRWACNQPVKNPSLLDKARGKKCQRVNNMHVDICSTCCRKRDTGALALNRDLEKLGELVTHTVEGKEVWRYEVEYPGPGKYHYWTLDECARHDNAGP
ncbi:hypothetical protein FIE12Z_1881 [Fusarium flagelliforme]|uniref:Uncharacterized protein n=1 Tax=Fusarium flagelliforme TaxID=2675880 RepID=A0A395N1L5_9HYPO|nr:hypothetical protein FIE12Z_1881 [Fusarium flagelliforme]